MPFEAYLASEVAKECQQQASLAFHSQLHDLPNHSPSLETPVSIQQNINGA
jgi:hypothetical protein